MVLSATHARATQPEVPAGFVEMYVGGVVPTQNGHTLVLVNPVEQVLLPLGIGLSEAVSIDSRLTHKHAARPMAHDLMDGLLKNFGGVVVRVQIDDVRDELFVGTIYIKRDGRVVALDARPSDAIALAIGSSAPIFVARRVLDRAALDAADLAELQRRRDASEHVEQKHGVVEGVLEL